LKIRTNSQYFHADSSAYSPSTFANIQYFLQKSSTLYLFSYVPINFFVSNRQKETVPPFPLSNTSRAVGALTLHHGGSEPPYGDNRHKKSCHAVAGFPTLEYVRQLQIYKHFHKKQTISNYLVLFQQNTTLDSNLMT